MSHGWFPQSHVYGDPTRSYVITVVSNYEGGDSARAQMTIDFGRRASGPPSNVPPSDAGAVLLPTDWTSVQALERAGDAYYVGGTGSDGRGRFGEFIVSSGGFSDLSNLLPPSYASVKVLSFGDGRLLVAADKVGQIFWGQLGDFSPETRVLHDLTDSMHAPLPYNWSINVMVFDGVNFLLAGAGQASGVEMYSPRTQWFTPLARRKSRTTLRPTVPFGAATRRC